MQVGSQAVHPGRERYAQWQPRPASLDQCCEVQSAAGKSRSRSAGEQNERRQRYPSFAFPYMIDGSCCGACAAMVVKAEPVIAATEHACAACRWKCNDAFLILPFTRHQGQQ